MYNLSLPLAYQQFNKGQSIHEYALLAGIIIVGALAFLGNISNTFIIASDRAGVRLMGNAAAQQNGVSRASSPFQLPGVNLGSNGAALPGLFQNSAVQGATEAEASNSLKSAEQLLTEALDWESNLQKNTAADYVKSLPQAMMAQAQQLLEEGQISGQDFESIKQLAGEGFRFAEAMAIIESTLKENQNIPDAQKPDMPVVFEGQTYRLQDLSKSLGYENIGLNATSVDSFLSGTTRAGGQLADSFVSQFSNTMSSPALQQPETKALIEELSYRILYSGEAVEHYMDPTIIKNGATTTYDVKAWLVGEMKENTTDSSAAICSAAQGASIAQQCQ